MDFLITHGFNGISYAALLFMLGGGLSLIFGVMKVVNIAHGTLYLIGGYIGYVAVAQTDNFFLALLAASIVVCLLGMTLERFFLRDLEGQDLRQMLMTMGITLILQDILLLIFEGLPLNIALPGWAAGSLRAGPYSFHVLRILMIAAAAVVYVVLWWFLERTRAGAVLRAAVDNKVMAQAVGINVDSVTMAVFGLGSFLAAFAGVVGCAFTAVRPGVDFDVLPLAFVVVIIGGMGSLRGALLGSVAVGLIDNFGKALVPELSYFTLFLPMSLILAFKPTGLLGREE
ncbi:MAG TPA: branched-chain amino acid ABC transporter permease [Thermodesulfobacteriota bacterium]|nr:branched-chain amino acid ABC transporter permease [Thermodesulfobacteriota bacterium]